MSTPKHETKAKRRLKGWLLASSVMSGAAVALSPFASGQGNDAPADTEVESRQETVIVTGSLIPQSENLIGTSPVSTISAEEFDTRGVLRAEDLINTLPQAFGAQGASLANGATGTASVNLRGLGASRTLVLMNGRRLPYGSTNIAAPDINIIPTALVKRVDVLTGGASATYGSDAISGVVNFVLDSEFEGAQFEANYSFYQHKNDNDIQSLLQEFSDNNPSQFEIPARNVIDGESVDLSAVIGGGFESGRGHISAFLTYQNVNQVLQGDRDYAQCALGTRNEGTEFTCAGSPTNQYTNILSLAETLPEGSWARVDPTTGEFVARDFTSDTFNYNPYNHYQRPNERYSFGSFLSYDIHPNASLYSELMFVQNETNSQIAPSGVFGYGVTGGNGGINCDNPYLSDQQLDYIGCLADGVEADSIIGAGDLIALRRNVEGGERNNDIQHQTFRGVIGVEGEIMDTSLGYDVYASFAQTTRNAVYNNDLSIRKLSSALYAVTDDDGNIVCNINVDEDPTNDDAACVPYDIWSGNAPDAAAIAYIVNPLNDTGKIVQSVVSGRVFGSLGDYGFVIPTASDAPAFAVGAEYRMDSITRNPDANFQSGDGAGQGGPTNAIDGEQDVWDVFGELDIPLIQERPGIYDLGIDLAYRKSYYESIDTDSYKFGIDYAPTSDIRLRGSYQRAVRAANIFELFDAQSIGLFDLDTGDPCATTPDRDPIYTEAQCANTGLSSDSYGSSGLYNPAGQYNTFGGGNEDLEPEESDTYTLGFVFTPSFIDGLTLTVDYFDIEVDGYINTVPEETTLTQCAQTGDQFFCDLINRGTGGTLWANSSGYIIATNVNTGSLATSGYDIQANYVYDLNESGALSFEYLATILDKLEFQALPDADVTPPEDCAGFYGGACQTNFGTGANPEFRHRANVTWTSPEEVFSVSGTWRFIDEVSLKDNDDPTSINAALDSKHYFDLAGSWAVRENVTLRTGVNNLLDEDPPLTSVAGTAPGNGNTYPQVYDSLGRYVFVNATLNF
ncbi:MAG: TonB-dependent receptor [Pseudomonadota bacterium]